MPTLKAKKISLKNKMFENVGNWISQLPTKNITNTSLEDTSSKNKPIKYLLKR